MKLDIATALHDPDNCPIERPKYQARRREKAYRSRHGSPRTRSYLPPHREIRAIARRMRAIINRKFDGELVKPLDLNTVLLVLQHEGALKDQTFGRPGTRQQAMQLAIQYALEVELLSMTCDENGIIHIVTDEVPPRVVAEIDLCSPMFNHCSSRYLSELSCH